MTPAKPIEAVEARRLFTYNVDTGSLRWRISRGNRVKAGDEVGAINQCGYRSTYIRDRGYLVHRLIWLVVFGHFPRKCIDHINHQKADNRLRNLRDVGDALNKRNRTMQANNTSGINGVIWDKTWSRWVARIGVDGKNQSLGSYMNWWDAACARKSAEAKIGFHPNHGKAA